MYGCQARPLAGASGTGATGPALQRKIKFSGRKIDKTGGKYTIIKRNGVTSEAFEGSLECSKRSFYEILEYSGRIWNNPGTSKSVTESSRTFWKFLHGSTSIHALYKSLSEHFRVSLVKTAIE
jgi:hypothetical protein